MIPLFKVAMDANQSSVIDVLHSGYIAEGDVVQQFEKRLQEKFKTPFVLATNSCTSAITLAYATIKEIDLLQRKKVITTPLTCAATNLPILHCGLDIEWCDINWGTLNIDFYSVNRPDLNTLAISFVHWGGSAVDYLELQDICQQFYDDYNLPLWVVEDCAHCLTTLSDKGQLVGTDIVPYSFRCFSTQAIKFLNSGGDGGFLICPNKQTYDIAKRLRWFGLSRDGGEDFRSHQDIFLPGYKMHQNNVCAQVALNNFSFAEENCEKHKANAKRYNELLFNKSIVYGESSYWLYTIIVDDNKKFKRYMADNGVQVDSVHKRNDKYSIFNKYSKLLSGMDYMEHKMSCIPVGWWLSNDDVKKIVELVNGYESS